MSLILIALLSVVSASGSANMSRIKSDEQVIFFPTAARLSEDRQSWLIPIHGWIYEPEESDLLRRWFVGQLQSWLPQQTTDDERRLFDLRMRLFLVDNERGKRIRITIGDQQHVLAPSAVDGHFLEQLEVPVAVVDRTACGDRVFFRAVTPEGDQRSFVGTVRLVSPKGVSVISDIDDTIKVSEVFDRQRLLQNTLMRPFVAVEGMAEAYAAWAAQGAQFHFVSMSPWQLYQPLSDFARAADFPEAVYHLQRFRAKDSSFWNLFADPQTAKAVIIEEIIAQYPQRQFVLVGDTSQKDPELYGQIARAYPDRVHHIYIRRVPRVPADSSRFDVSFAGIPADKWTLFDSAHDLPPTP